MTDMDKLMDELMDEWTEEERLAKQKDDLAFLAWAEKTHARYLNNLKDGYRRFKEGKNNG